MFPNCRTQGEHPDPCPFDPGPSVEDIGCLHDLHDSARMSMIRRSDKNKHSVGVVSVSSHEVHIDIGIS